MTWTTRQLIERLEVRLRQNLPGRKAQRRFSPELSYGRHSGPVAHDARSAAVMALLYPGPQGWNLPLIVRPDDSPTHAGQISFPGGISEAGESVERTALRELHEEIGIDGPGVEVLGRLTAVYVFNSNFLVTPVVGVHRGHVQFRLCPSEVADVIELPIDHLLDSSHYGQHVIQRGDVSFAAPHIRFGKHLIWGATSMMLGELIEVLGHVGGGPTPLFNHPSQLDP